MVLGRGVRGAGVLKVTLSIGSGAPQQSWCQLMLSVANRSCKATGVTAPEDMALIKRMPKWLFTCLLLGVWASCCTQHHGVDGYSAQGWSYMLLHSSTVLNLSTFTALYQQHCGTSEQLCHLQPTVCRGEQGWPHSSRIIPDEAAPSFGPDLATAQE